MKQKKGMQQVEDVNVKLIGLYANGLAQHEKWVQVLLLRPVR